jgi:UDP-N-acetylmuramate--alanine ligase
MSISKLHYHFVGIGGAGMSALARIYAAKGVVVTGSDSSNSATLVDLSERYAIRTFVGHNSMNVGAADLVITTAAVRGANPEVERAVQLGIPVITRAETLGRLMSQYARSVAVTGTHGKTTTSAMISQMLVSAGADPTAVIGGDIPSWGSNARVGDSDIFVAEACEAYGSFFELFPQITVVTNIEADHLDYYKDMSAIRGAFKRVLGQTSYYSVLCVDDPETAAVARDIKENVATYGISPEASIRAVNINLGPTSTYTVDILGNKLGEIELSVPGIHNIANSLAAVAIGNLLDIQFSDIATGLKSFTGTGRRFERLAKTEGDVLVIDDYAHHPTEIAATLQAAASSYPERRIIAVFQPHLPSRTRDFMGEFASSFGLADLVFLTDIYLSREKPLDGVTGKDLAIATELAHGRGAVTYVPNKHDLPAEISKIVRRGDLVITLGAGDIRSAAEGLINLLHPTTESLTHV